MRDLNVAADVLAKLGSDRVRVPPDVFVQELQVPSIKQEDSTSTSTPTPNVQVLVFNPAWTHVFIDYIRDHMLSADKVEVEQITRRSKNYVLVETIDKFRMNCLWSGSAHGAKGYNLAAWGLVTMPKNKDGLGVKKLYI
jgi:hypothetical protein